MSGPVYRERLAGLGELTLVPVDPGRHAGLLHDWVTQPRARFWGMASRSVDEVRDIYAYIDAQATHHAYLIVLEGTPVGLFQTYEPEHDPVGACYPVRPGDVGMHLLLAPGPRIPGFTATVGAALLRYLFSEPSRQWVVLEPDARNGRALRRLASCGFKFGAVVDLPHKRAQLAFLPRWRFERLLGRGAGEPPR